MQQVLEKKLTGAIFGLKQGTKTATEVLPILNRMKELYPHISAEYESKYATALVSREKK